MQTYEIIENFVKRYEHRSMATVENYRYIVTKFFNIIKKDPNTYFNKPDETEIKKDITTYWGAICDQAPKSRDTKLFCIKSFMMWNEIELKTKFYKELRESEKEKGALTEDYVPTTDEIKRLLNHAKPRERAIILALCTSGIRIGELLKVEKDMLHLDENPPRIHLPGKITKNGHKRDIFLTSEARDSLKEWQQIREKYLDKLKGRNNLPKSKRRYRDVNEPQIFPFSYNPIRDQWNKLTTTIKLGGKDARTNRRHLHIHVLRKWSNSRMLLTIPQPMVYLIIGHKGYLQEYDKYGYQELGTYYKKAIPDLCIFGTPDQEETQKRIQRLEHENKDMKEDIQRLMVKIVSMEK